MVKVRIHTLTTGCSSIGRSSLLVEAWLRKAVAYRFAIAFLCRQLRVKPNNEPEL
ncbi:MAG: hypothetical protein KME25_15265 [Symplocastrum torsivum CPER-KK1]|uniref:Uncharacterized protein n=1 Tax=Symplocastrum torsivum CPER-KK1 TaxID=450513 RepID=A0A951UAE4_9CYAN|nr:hypothetical protein [Symplocastrum torsivum CPER-KK1]